MKTNMSLLTEAFYSCDIGCNIGSSSDVAARIGIQEEAAVRVLAKLVGDGYLVQQGVIGGVKLGPDYVMVKALSQRPVFTAVELSQYGKIWKAIWVLKDDITRHDLVVKTGCSMTHAVRATNKFLVSKKIEVKLKRGNTNVYRLCVGRGTRLPKKAVSAPAVQDQGECLPLLRQRIREVKTQAAVAAELGISPAALSGYLGGNYGADTSLLVAKIKHKYKDSVVACPVLGKIVMAACMVNRDKAEALGVSGTNPKIRALRKQCLKCLGDDYGTR